VRAVVQRVAGASVHVDGAEVGAIGRGLLVLLGVQAGDTEAEAAWLARKVASLRIFSGESGGFDLGLDDVGGALLVVSQFTLLGDVGKGRRPNFVAAAPPERAAALYERFVAELRQGGWPVETGRFGAMMEVRLVNDGPVTLVVDRTAPDTEP
jgi:D-tyrosyl-tRNA(Tyr) deacylase